MITIRKPEHVAEAMIPEWDEDQARSVILPTINSRNAVSNNFNYVWLEAISDGVEVKVRDERQRLRAKSISLIFPFESDELINAMKEVQSRAEALINADKEKGQ